jgi:demethoxyubiquinone hydroxylase (CLK1/Coq7/Cat5 family)
MTTYARQKAIIELMNRGIESPTEIVKLLESEYGIVTTRQTVTRDITQGVQPMTEEIIEEHKEKMLDNLDNLMRIAYDKGMRGDMTATKAYGGLSETRVRILAKIVEIQQAMNQQARPIYEIRIGDFAEAKKKEEKKQDDV